MRSFDRFKTRPIFSLILILFTCGLLCAFACPTKQDGTPIKPSESVLAARSLAYAPVGMRAASDIFFELETADTIKEPLAQAIYKGTEESQTLLDQAVKEIEAGQFDSKKKSTLIKNISKSINDKIQTGLVGVTDPETIRITKEWSAVINFAIAQAVDTFTALRPPITPPDTPTILAQSKVPKSEEQLTAAAWSPDLTIRVLGVSSRAALEWGQIKNTSDVKALWDLAKAKSEALHLANKERIR